MTITEYVGKMRTLGDEMAAVGRPLEEEELIEYIFTGLDMEFNPIVSALIAKREAITVSDVYTDLLAFGTRMHLMTGGGNSGSSVNAANRGRSWLWWRPWSWIW